MNLYIYSQGSNIGDVAGHYILQKHFPQFKVDPSSKKYLFFGGSTFYCHHGLDVEEVIYFGNGLSCFGEMVLPKCPFTIYPRGYTTRSMLKAGGIRCKQVIGDIVQFLALDETVTHNPAMPDLYIRDAFSNMDFIPTGAHVVGVCDTIFTKGIRLSCSIPEFREDLALYGKVISSQIHPFLIALMFGKPAKLIPKDVRALDICNFFDIPFDCTVDHAMKAREKAISNIPALKELFLSIIQPEE